MFSNNRENQGREKGEVDGGIFIAKSFEFLNVKR